LRQSSGVWSTYERSTYDEPEPSAPSTYDAWSSSAQLAYADAWSSSAQLAYAPCSYDDAWSSSAQLAYAVGSTYAQSTSVRCSCGESSYALRAYVPQSSDDLSSCVLQSSDL